MLPTLAMSGPTERYFPYSMFEFVSFFYVWLKECLINEYVFIERFYVFFCGLHVHIPFSSVSELFRSYKVLGLAITLLGGV